MKFFQNFQNVAIIVNPCNVCSGDLMCHFNLLADVFVQQILLYYMSHYAWHIVK